MIRRASKPLAVLLCGTVLLQGCASDQQRVEKVRELIRPGMTRAEVRAELGEPISMTTTEASTANVGGESWLYRFDPGSNAFLDIMLGVLVVVVVVAVVAVAVAGSGGGGNLGGGWGGGGGGGDDPLYEFDVHFDKSGRVDGISPLRTVAKQ